jgi:hypothetical protein
VSDVLYQYEISLHALQGHLQLSTSVAATLHLHPRMSLYPRFRLDMDSLHASDSEAADGVTPGQVLPRSEGLDLEELLQQTEQQLQQSHYRYELLLRHNIGGAVALQVLG